MTSADTKVSHSRILQLAWPIMLSNLSVPLVGAVDTAVTGYMDGPHHVGAIALGALIFSIFFWGFGFLKMGTTGFVARAFGAGDHGEIQLTLLRAMLLACVLSLLLLVLQKPILWLSLHILEASDRTEALTATYYDIRIWSAPASLGVYAITGALIGLQKTRAALTIQLVLNLTNIGLNLLFVPVLKLGIPGVAWASVIAEYLSLAVALYLVRSQLRLDRQTRARALRADALVHLMSANVNIFIRTVCLTFAFSWFTVKSAGLGELVLAANAILMNFQNIMAYGLDGFAAAAEGLGGQAFGARHRRMFRDTVVKTTQWAGIFSLVAMAIYLLFGEPLLHLFTDQADVLDMASDFLPWLIISPILSVWSFQLDGIFIGSSQTRAMRNAMLVSTVIYLASLHFALPHFGNHGLWLSLMIFMLARAVTLIAYMPGVFRKLDD